MPRGEYYPCAPPHPRPLYAFTSRSSPSSPCYPDIQGSYCCYLKNAVTAPSPSSVKDIASGLVSKSLPAAPPSGMRSGVPQGGIFAGSIELRGDGALYEWTIVNQSPAGAAKFPVLSDAFFALQANTSRSAFSKSLRTHPPAGVPGVAALTYEGAHPVGRLTVLDADLPDGLSAALYAYSSYVINDINSSSIPAILYTLELNNTAEASVNASFLFNLPLALEENMRRVASKTQQQPAAATAADCWRACTAAATCTSYTFDASQGCLLGMDATTPLNVYSANSTSGVPGSWSVNGSCLTLNRRTGQGAQGNASLCIQDAQATVKYFSADTAAGIFSAFSSGQSTALQGAYGAVGIQATVAPQSVRQLTLAFSWFFPHRDYLGEDIGNQYGYREWNSSIDVGQAALTAAPRIVGNITAMHNVLFHSSLPLWLQDVMVNSLSHIRSAWWTRDGRIRQWGEWYL